MMEYLTTNYTICGIQQTVKIIHTVAISLANDISSGVAYFFVIGDLLHRLTIILCDPPIFHSS